MDIQVTFGPIERRPSFLARQVARIHPRLIRRGLSRIQGLSVLAITFSIYPTAIVFASGWAEAFQEPGVLGSAFAAIVAVAISIRVFFEFMAASMKRAEKRVSEAIPTHEHPEFDAIADLSARVDHNEHRIQDLVRGQDDILGELRRGLTRQRETGIRQAAALAEMKAAQTETTGMVREIFKALVPPPQEG